MIFPRLDIYGRKHYFEHEMSKISLGKFLHRERVNKINLRVVSNTSSQSVVNKVELAIVGEKLKSQATFNCRQGIVSKIVVKMFYDL